MSSQNTFDLALDVAVVALTLPGLAKLTGDDRRRAIALALTRELGVQASGVQFTEAPLTAPRAHTSLIAFAPKDAGERRVDLSFANAVSDGEVFWLVDKRGEGWLFSDQGVTSLALPNSANDAIPAQLLALASSRAKAGETLRISLVGPKAQAVANEAWLQHWAAALGANFDAGLLALSGATSTLSPAPSMRVATPSTSLDRALKFAAAASVVCAVIAGARYALLPPAMTISTSAPPARAGELWYRATAAAPALNEFAREATFASGAWVIAAPKLPLERVQSVTDALTANAFAVQAVREPELRLRVQAQ